MNGTDTLKPPTATTLSDTPTAGFANRSKRLERRLGWVLWAALATLLIAISI